MTCAFLNRIAIGRMNLSYFGFFLVKSSGTKQTFVTIRFQAFFFRLPELIILKTSASACARTEEKDKEEAVQEIVTFREWDVPLSGFLLPLLLDHVR